METWLPGTAQLGSDNKKHPTFLTSTQQSAQILSLNDHAHRNRHIQGRAEAPETGFQPALQVEVMELSH